MTTSVNLLLLDEVNKEHSLKTVDEIHRNDMQASTTFIIDIIRMHKRNI